MLIMYTNYECGFTGNAIMFHGAYKIITNYVYVHSSQLTILFELDIYMLSNYNVQDISNVQGEVIY